MFSPRLKIIELKVRDWLSAVEWFCSRFGLNILLIDHLKQYALLGEDYGTESNLSIKGSSEPFEGNRVLLQWEVFDLPGFIFVLQQQGVTILKPIQEASDEWYRRAIIEGPEGIPLLLFEFIDPTQ